MSGGGGDTTTTTKSKPWSGIQPYLSSGYSQFDQAAQNIAPYYPGQTYANFTQPQVQGQSGLLDYAGSLGPTSQNSLDAANQGLTGWKDPANNPYLQDYLSSAIRPLTQNYQENVLPAIRDNAEMYGGAGSRTGLAEGVASRSYLDSIGDISSNVYNNAWNTGQDTMTKTQALLPSIYGAGAMPYQYMMGVGADQQGMDQQGINEAMNRYNYNNNADYNRWKDYLSTLQGTPWGGSSTTGANPNAVNPISGIAGGAMSGAALGSIVPGLGTGYGALLGGGLGGLMSIW